MTVLGVPDRPGAAMAVFSKIAAKNIAMDMIVQNVGADGLADISFTVDRDELPATIKAVEDAVEELGAEGYTYDDDVSMVSVVGLGMATPARRGRKMFRALAEKGINIQMITTSEIKISALVDRQFAQEALRTVHEAFHLQDRPPSFPPDAGAVRRTARPRGGPVNGNSEAASPGWQPMEKLIIDILPWTSRSPG